VFNQGHKGGAMRAFSGSSTGLATLVALSTVSAAVGCTQVGVVQARRDFKAANAAYAQQDYKQAGELYKQAVEEDPNLIQAYFYLGNSLDNQYKPSKKGEPANEALLQKAVEHYQTAATKLAASAKPDDKKLGQLSLQYLVAAYGPDKLNDPAKAEPVVQKMIQLEPQEPSNYFALAKIYEDAGAYPEAEQTFLSAKTAKPSDASVYLQLAGYYNRQGEFGKTIDALEQRAAKEPSNPEAFQTIAGYYWDETTRDARLTEAQKKDYVGKGLEAVERALKLKADYVEALTFKGLLLRLQANMEKNPGKQQELLKQADSLRDKANDLRKSKAAG
jgi:tetratricopeptide (TPR) repeat protein